jgi:hypothetical protein
LSVVMLVHIQNSKYVCAQTDAMEIPWFISGPKVMLELVSFKVSWIIKSCFCLLACIICLCHATYGIST